MSACARQCWIFAAGMGLLVLVMATLGGGVGFVPGLFLALVTGGLLGGLLTILFCQGADDVEEWARPVDNAKDPDTPGARSIRRDGAPVAQVPIARPQRPEGMTGAPQGASAQAAQAVTFDADGAGPQATTDASRLARGRNKAGGLADAPETAHSGSVRQGESA